MPVTCVNLWDSVLEKLRAELPKKSFNTWFSHTTLEDISREQATVGAPNLFIKEWLRDHYQQKIAGLLAAEYGSAPAVAFRIVGESFQKLRQSADAAAPAQPSPQPAKVRSAPPKVTLNQNYTFGNFIAGPANIVAREACRACLEAGGEFSPLLLWGESGTGKSHLLQALCHEAFENNVKTVYTTAERFTNEFSAAVEQKRRAGFQAKMRSAEILVVDDIQHFTKGNRAATQEEFVHTVDALCDAGRQVVLSCDRAPQELEGLNAALLHRLLAGLTLPLCHPDHKTAAAIIARKAIGKGLRLDEGTIDFIATRHSRSVRELEGAVKSLAAVSRFGNVKIDAASAAQILGESGSQAAQPCPAPASLQEIAAKASEAFGLKTSDLCGRKRSQRIREARSVAMILGRDITGCSFAEIGAYFGGRSHATTLTGISNGRKLLKADLALAKKFDLLKTSLGGQKKLF